MDIQYFVDPDDNHEVIQAAVAGLEETDSEVDPDPVIIKGLSFHRDADGVYILVGHFLYGLPPVMVQLGLIVQRVMIVENLEYHEFDPIQKGIYKHPDHEDDPNIAAVVERDPDADDLLCLRVIADDLDMALELMDLVRGGELNPVTHWADRRHDQAGDDD